MEGIDQVAPQGAADSRFHGSRVDDIDATVEQRRDGSLDADELEHIETVGRIELNQHIEVAIGPRAASDHTDPYAAAVK